MPNKNSKTDLVLNSAENLADEILFKTANTFLEDAVKSIPFAALISSSIQAYAQFRTLKEQKQLLAFIQETETNNQNFIKHFFQDKNNTELGLEILGILDQTYLEHQARMIGRATLLKQQEKISKQEFDKYTYIITKLNNHLISLVEETYQLHLQRLTDPLQANYPQNSIDLQNANMDLLSFGFLIFNQPPHWGDEYEKYLKSQYTVQEIFFYFYHNIFKD
ncbi:MAG: hypothetical protein ACN6NW_13980 [Acinetobacter amyesii]|uniref:hypothetical protein n=1 Tax=Acinetobacter amyesii TaxID=2942470 RepID=UPI003D02218B